MKKVTVKAENIDLVRVFKSERGLNRFIRNVRNFLIHTKTKQYSIKIETL